MLVQLSHGAPVVHVHYVLAVAILAVYEDWTTYAAAIAFVLAEHLAVLGIDPGRSFADDVQPLRYTLVDLVFVLGTSATQLVFWSYANQARERDRAYQRELAELSRGRTTVEARIAELDATREDLLATVSHEFRTPLTAIQGAALTMRKHRSRLPEQRVDEMLDAVVANTERLGRLLENMLTAAEARVPDQRAVTDVARRRHRGGRAGRAGARPADAQRRGRRSTVACEARIEASALHQILANLLDNAIVHAQPGSHAIISAAEEGDDVVVTVANEAEGVDAQMLADLFEPFTQRDTSSTRSHEGAGVGLYVVRRLVEVSHGSLSVRSQPGWVSIEVRLPLAVEPHGRPQHPGAARRTAAR